MASQQTKVIDVTRSYLPMDPEAFPESMHIDSREDLPEDRIPVIPFEGYNFMPTSYGYKSYFGTRSTLAVGDLIARVDDLFIIQRLDFKNIAVALTDEGIYVKEVDEDTEETEWQHVIQLDRPEEGTIRNWTKCVIGNEIFAYRAGGPEYYQFSLIPRAVSQGEIEAGAAAGMHPANEWYPVIPTFLNMEGQEGIFKAGSRLGFWDTSNATAFSSVDDFAQFTPSVLTGAGIVTFANITGNIVNILPFEDGFVIYSTKSIVNVTRSDSGTYEWNDALLDYDNGIAFLRECCVGENPDTHYAYTTRGLLKINRNVTTQERAEVTAIPVVDFLKESEQPVYLKVLENRYLFLQVLDSNYLNSLVSFTVETIPASVQVYPPFNKFWEQYKVDQAYSGIRTLKDTAYKILDNYLVTEGLPLRKEGTEIEPVLEYKWGEYARKALADWSVVGWTGPEGVALDNIKISDPDAQALLDGGGYYYPYNVSYEYLEYIPVLPTKEVLDSEIPIPNSGKEFVDKVLEYTDLYGQKMRSAMATLSRINPHPEDEYMIHFFSVVGDPVFPIVAPVELISTSQVLDIPPDYLYIGRVFGVRYKAPFGGPFDVDSITVEYEGHRAATRPVAFSPYYEVTTTESKISVTRTVALNGTVGCRVRSKGIKDETSIYGRKRWYLYTESYYAETGSSFGSTTASVEIVGYNYTDEDDVKRFVAFSELDSLVNLEGGQSYTLSDSGSITYPPSSFLLQRGSIGPVYPTIPGAIVYDTQLQKWGKMKLDYKVLIDWSPLNSLSSEIVPYETFGVKGGVLKPDGTIALFDKYPVDSYIKYGKIGYYRQGFTTAEEIRIHFRTLSTGKVRIEGSLDGRAVELGITKEQEFTDAMSVTIYPSTSARWHTISLIGSYDIKYIEFRGTRVSNR